MAGAIIGAAGNDALSGTASNDTIHGLAGQDTILAGQGNDTVYGGDGSDSLSGEGGDDVVYGGTGSPVGTTFIQNGSFDASSAFWTGTDLETTYAEGAYMPGGSTNRVAEIDGYPGQATVMQQSFDVSGAQSAQLTFRAALRSDGTLGIDGFRVDVMDPAGTVIGTMNVVPASKATWVGHSLNCSFPAAGSYTLRFTELGDNSGCGAIVDDIQITATSAVTDLSADTLSGGDGSDTLYGFAGNDALYGGAGRDTLAGGAGDDSLSGGDAEDSLSGGDGADTLDGGSSRDTLDGGAGADSLAGGDGEDSLTGGDGDDRLDGGSSQDSLFGGAGADSLTGADGDDSLDGGTDADTLDGGAGQDNLAGADGADSALGGAGDDRLYGGAGADVLEGGADNDYAEGGAGNDTMLGGTGIDRLYGGDDADTFQGPYGPGWGDHVDGGEGGTDNDTLNLAGQGAHRVVYTSTNQESGRVEYLDANGHVTGAMTFDNIERVVTCFTPGTLIATAQGLVPVEGIGPGDRVITRDSGMQAVRWVGRRDLGPADLIVRPAFRPVRIAAGALGNGLPERALIVSPQHRMLIASDRNCLLFDAREVLVAAKDLVNGTTITREPPGPVSYVHLMFDHHELILAEGSWSESFQPGAATLDATAAAVRDELLALFPVLATAGGLATYRAARRSLKHHEALLIKL